MLTTSLATLLVLSARADDPQSRWDYVLGFDPDADASILGGSHRIEGGDLLREAYGSANRPGNVHPELTGAALVFDEAVLAGETDWFVFASSWWPMSTNGIAERWRDTDEPSPTERYDALVFPGETVHVPAVTHWYYDELELPLASRPPKHTHEALDVGPATAWELQNHGIYQDVHPDSWWGHCNGLASYTTGEALRFPTRGIDVKLDGDGKVVECTEDTTDCVRFRKGDIEALFTEVWFDDAARMGGQRCEERPDAMERDEYGRPVDPACRDLNPATFHVTAVHLLGRGAEHLVTGETMHTAFVVDYSMDWEVWNFPVVAFEITSFQRIDEAAATALVGGEGDYPWNAAATRWVHVEMTYETIADPVGNGQMIRPADERDVQRVPVELAYVLELDDGDRILGGEWIDSPVVLGPDSRELHPDFVWIPTDNVGYGEKWNDRGGSSDNPFLAYPKLTGLLGCANDPGSCAASPSGDTDVVPSPEPQEGCSCDGSMAYGVPLVGALVLLGVVGRRRSTR